MTQSGKRIYTELNVINLENRKNPNTKKFIIDSTPFNGDDDSQPPTIVKEGTNQYYIITGRVLPTSNTYNQSAFRIKIKVPIDYPFKPPQVEMLTPIYHPNIGPEGKVCIPMIRSSKNWKATNSLTELINAIVDYIDHPNIDEAHSKAIADQYLNNRTEFEKQAAQLIEQNRVSRQ